MIKLKNAKAMNKIKKAMKNILKKGKYIYFYIFIIFLYWSNFILFIFKK